MPVHVLPSTVKAEEFGFIQGEVTSVSKFPVTEVEMFLLLENQSLVDVLSTGRRPAQGGRQATQRPIDAQRVRVVLVAGSALRDHPRDALHGDICARQAAPRRPRLTLRGGIEA